jgi:hypothetical protein
VVGLNQTIFGKKRTKWPQMLCLKQYISPVCSVDETEEEAFGPFGLLNVAFF